MIRKGVLILICCLGLAGCIRTPGGIAASNIPLDPHGYHVLGPTSASACKVNLFGILPVSGSNYLVKAEKKALKRVPGTDALVDITVDRVSKYFILWSQVCTEVRATAVQLDE